MRPAKGSATVFHTNSAVVFEYLSRFTAWRPYEHRVLASVDGQQVPIPINLDTVNRLYGLALTSFELEAFFAKLAERIAKRLEGQGVPRRLRAASRSTTPARASRRACAFPRTCPAR